MKLINEKTAIPIGLAIVAIGGGAVWLTTLHLATASNTESIKEIRSDVKPLSEIKTDLAVIKTDLEYIKAELKKGK